MNRKIILIDKPKNIKDAYYLNLPLDAYYSHITFFSFLNEIKKIINKKSSQTDISSIKKRIKYCENPMEKKMLQQELNVSYKE